MNFGHIAFFASFGSVLVFLIYHFFKEAGKNVSYVPIKQRNIPVRVHPAAARELGTKTVKIHRWEDNTL